MFLGMRKQKKALAATSEMQDSLQVGDRVQTTAGLYATIASLDDDTVDLEIADGVITTWSRLVIRERVVETTETDEYDDDSVSEIEESAADTEIRLTKES
ncbi:hypothetical protein rerp_27370 [Rhodococcus erythropolis]|nr:hypothetical protein rerp_27370 [Rhodococcus erythropolis]